MTYLVATITRLLVLSATFGQAVSQNCRACRGRTSTLVPRPSTTSATSTSTASAPTSTAGIWLPSAGVSWEIQLIVVPKKQAIAASSVSVYDIDLFDTPTEIITYMHEQKKKVICYFSAGTYEPWRTDASQFPPASLGKGLPDWPDEKWIDYRQQKVKDIMTARLKLAKSKGCDAVDPDNIDGFSNDHGFSQALTRADALVYLKFLSDTAHSLGMSFGLKNGAEIVPDAAPFSDFAVNEVRVRRLPDPSSLLT